jgi:hypothetical protein
MSGEPDNLVLVYLRRIDEKVDRVIDDIQDLKHRVTSLEGRVASIRVDMAAMSLRMDRSRPVSTASSGGSTRSSRLRPNPTSPIGEVERL